MAAETSVEAHLPVSIVLFKLHFQLLWEKIYAKLFLSSSDSTTTNTQSDTSSSTPLQPPPIVTADEDHHSSSTTPIELDSSWDLYLMVLLLGLIGALYTMRRQRAALLQQQQQQQQQQRQGQAPLQ